MRKTLTLFIDSDDNIVCGWKLGRSQYFLDSSWQYKRPGGSVFNLKDELKNLDSDYDRVNKKFNIFRHNNEHYFYSDGNTDPWIIMTHFILEVLSFGTQRDYRRKYLDGKRISVINNKLDLIPSNIKVDNMLFSDIIRIIFSTDADILKDYEFLLDYCDGRNDMDELFKSEKNIDQVHEMYKKLTLSDQKSLLQKIIEDQLK